MDPLAIKKNEEAAAQRKVVKALTLRGWYVSRLAGNRYQSALSDLLAVHAEYGSRFIEMKKATGYRLRPSQYFMFEAMEAQRIGTWILTGDHELMKLFGRPNWRAFAKSIPKEPARPPDRQPDNPERQLQDDIVAELTYRGYLCVNTFSGLYQVGFPDLIVCKDGAFRLADVKMPNGRLTAAQKITFPKFAEHGCEVRILRTSQYSVLEELLK